MDLISSKQQMQRFSICNYTSAKRYINGDKTQKELAQLWGNVSHHTISRALKKLGITRKKKHIVIKKDVKKRGVNLGKN